MEWQAGWTQCQDGWQSWWGGGQGGWRAMDLWNKNFKSLEVGMLKKMVFINLVYNLIGPQLEISAFV